MTTIRLVSTLFLCSLISVAVAQAPNDPGEPGVITGKVIDSAGKPVPDSRVYVREHDAHVAGAIRYVTTGQSGEFRIENLRPGDYDVYAVPSQSGSMLIRSARRVHLPADRPIGKVTVQVGSPRNQKS